MTAKTINLYKHANLLAKAKIGLEVHAQLNIRSKLFSQGINSTEGKSNSNLDLFDIALPGTLPKINKHALNLAILASLGLNCEVQDVIHFDRKNYFYTDMPAGYQLTQYNKPIAKNGFIDFIVKAHHKSVIAHKQRYDIVKYLYEDSKKQVDCVRPYIKRSIIKQVQLEQDSAKTLIHTSPDQSEQELCHLVDYNRSGAALIEIVFEPDLTNHLEATSLVKELIVILKSLKTCDCELQDGSLRVDANVSIEKFDNQDTNSNRVELKNLNSLKALSYGIEHEINRQSELIYHGSTITQETRTFDSKSRQTVPLRLKEEAIDYRYVPEPSIPSIKIESTMINQVREKLPKNMSSDIRRKLIEEHNLDLTLVPEIIEEPGLSDYFFNIMKNKGEMYDANVVADFLIYTINNLKGITLLPFEFDMLNSESEFMTRLNPTKVQQILDMLSNDELSFATSYEVIKYIYTTNDRLEPRGIVKNFDWFLINDREEVVKHCSRLIEGMKVTSKQYRKKRQKRHLWLMLNKLAEITDNRVSTKLAIDVLNELILEKTKEPDKQ